MLDLKLRRVLLAKLVGFVYPKIAYSFLSPLHVVDVPQSALPAANWVRVRNRLAGICGSDFPLVHVDTDVRTSVAALPHYRLHYPGHEVLGEVVEIGQDVRHLNVGDRVVLQYNPNCLSSGAKPVCRACAAGDYNQCEYGSLPGPQPIGGGWSEEMLLHEQQLFRLPMGLTDEQGVMLEPTAVALHGVLRCLPQADDSIMIVGAGTIGLLTLQILRTLVPKAQISVLARHPFQVEQATRLGADHVIYTDSYAGVQRATHARLYKGLWGNQTLVGGYDVIYDTVGQQKTLHHALRWLRRRGTMVLVGLGQHMMHIDLTPVWHREINLLGSLSHGRETWPLEPHAGLRGTSAGPSTFSVVTELIQERRIQPEQLITHRFALNNYKDALMSAHYKKGSQSIKVLFDYTLFPASAVPNVRASALLHRPALAQPQGDASLEDALRAQSETGSRQDSEQEAVPQSNSAQQPLLPKILDTPLPQPFKMETWRTILNRQDIEQDEISEDTGAGMQAVKPQSYNSPVSSRAVESPQTPIPPPFEPTPAFIVETPETKTDEFEANALSAQPMLESQQAEDTSEFSPSADNMDMLVQFPVELPVNEGEALSAFSDTVGVNELAEEQLPTETVLDNLFDANSSSMPEFLAQLSNLATPIVSETSVEDTESSTFSEGPVNEGDYPVFPEMSVENAEVAILPEMDVNKEKTPGFPEASVTALPIALPEQVAGDQADVVPTPSVPKVRRRKTSKAVNTEEGQVEGGRETGGSG
jgi:threonine dehydrogenase-like Zn-dependent dehydrogenase